MDDMKDKTIMQPFHAKGYESPSRWFTITVGVYGFVVTVLLAAAIAGGAVYLKDLKQDLDVCKETNNNMDTTSLDSFTDEYKIAIKDAPNDPQKIKVNTLTGTEIFIRNGTVVVFDFPKNIGGLYSAEYNRCFLMGGIDERIASPEDLKRELDAMTGEQEGVGSADDDIISYKTTPLAVSDQTFFPEALAPFCKGRPTYWLTPLLKDGVTRTKRDIGITVRICAGIRLWRWSLKVCVTFRARIRRQDTRAERPPTLEEETYANEFPMKRTSADHP